MTQPLPQSSANNYVSVGPNLARDLPRASVHYSDYLRNPVSDSFFLGPTTEDEIRSTLMKLKNSCSGWDSLSAKILKQVCNSISRPLSHICNLSFSCGIVPSELKVARVSPIFKKGSPNVLLNYRPISLLPCFSKIIEKIVASRLRTFLERHKILFENQFGFRKNHNTTTAVSYLVNEIVKNYENSLPVLGVFIDLQKAFDTIDHEILLAKLQHYGIRGVALEWFASYLNNRKQFVKVRQAESEQLTILCGVPQGSILGPLLFIMYINDIQNCSICSKILYADDTNMFISGSDVNDLFRRMNIELEKLSDWLIANKLSLNVAKTHYVLFQPGRNTVHDVPQLTINGQSIERKSSTLFLGVVLDSKLNWHEHISYIKGKIAKNIGIINKVKRVLNVSTLRTLYYAFVFPYLSYCIECWGSAAKTRTSPLLTLQKRCCRIITNSPPRTPSLPIFRRLNILPLEQLYHFSVLTFMFRFHQNSLPLPNMRMFASRSLHSSYQTRQVNHLQLPRFRHHFSQRTIAFAGPKLWNNISSLSLHNCSFAIFKTKLRKFLWDSV